MPIFPKVRVRLRSSPARNPIDWEYMGTVIFVINYHGLYKMWACATIC